MEALRSAPKLSPQKHFWLKIGGAESCDVAVHQGGGMIKRRTKPLTKVPNDGPTFQSML